MHHELHHATSIEDRCNFAGGGHNDNYKYMQYRAPCILRHLNILDDISQISISVEEAEQTLASSLLEKKTASRTSNPYSRSSTHNHTIRVMKDQVGIRISPTLSTTVVVLASLWIVGAVPATSPCPQTCTLPNCRCASKEIPGGLRRDQVPQMVTISFDDAIRVQDYEMFYSKILRGRRNPNGCNVSVTFFASHKDTDYSLAAELANSGHELAVHSVTHRTPNTFWSEDRNNTEELTHEILDMRDILSRWAHVPKSNVAGYRTPFLASSENQLKILHENDFLYDCTMVTNEMYWPFTLDYKSPICSSPAVCPEESLPGLWVIPNINKVQNSGFSCSMIDGCAHPPKSTRDSWMHFFMHNFERHYNNSKAPFGLYAHASWFYFPDSAQRLQAFMDFLDYLGSLEDVYIVTMSQLIAWSRNPTPLDQLSTFDPWQCLSNTTAICSHTEPKICNYNVDDEEYIIRLCKDDSCPAEYPNITNPQGENRESTSVPVSSDVHFTSNSITPTGHMPASSETTPVSKSASVLSSSMNIYNSFHSSIDLTTTDTTLPISVTTPPTSLSPSPTPATTTPTSPCPLTCSLPDCQCASKEIPGGLRQDQVPQMVTISFDDAIRVQDYEMFYSKILRGRRNPNGCNVSVTFFASHKDTDYSLAAELANSGHELAVHSVTHRTPSTFWSEDRDNTEELTHEILDMRDILSQWAHVPKSNVVGYRTPFLASSENQLKILRENDFLYDCTMVTNEMYWPFTLDYKSPICSSPAVCPEESLPGLWVIPNINKVQNSSFSCSMIDSCAHPPKYTRDHWMHFFMHNFERHYNNSKAPFGLYAHASWFFFHDSAQRLQAFMDFLDYLGSLEDVYIVTMSQLIAWSRNPTPLDQLSTFDPWQCLSNTPPICSHTEPNICNYNVDDEEYIIRLCKDDSCPVEYPNITNPQGENRESTSVPVSSDVHSTSKSITPTGHMPASSEATGTPVSESASVHNSPMNSYNSFHSSIDLTTADTAVTTADTALPISVTTPPTSLSPSPTPATTAPTSPCPLTCSLPDCQCASKEIPGGLRRDQIPQMVTISFDDAIRVQDYEMFYSKILRGRRNPNGCNVSVTFFASHKDTDYSLAAELANSGHELAVHSVTHRTPSTFWSEDRDNTEELTHEILDMRDILSQWAHVPKSNVVGYRTPFLASSENQLKILRENDFLYDCTMVTNEMYWPFTLDYKSPICSSPAVCPEESLPGLWVIPNINKVQNSSFSCSMIDSCAHPPKYTRDHWMHFFMHNFERHYNNSKAPFGLYAHASWFFFHDSAQRLQAFMDFLDYLGSLEDVYIVSMSQLIAWSRNPTPLDQLSTFDPWQCLSNTPPICSHTEPNICNYNVDDEEYIIRLCKDDSCPAEYPNITNPQGENRESTSVPVSSDVHSTSKSITPTGHMPASSEATGTPVSESASVHSSSMNSYNSFHSSIDLTTADTALPISVTTPPTSLSPSPTSATTTPNSPCPLTCSLPDCQCASKEIPGGLRRDQVPQMVTISFDDAIRVQDYEMFYSKILRGRRNPNGCNVSVTFFASHKDTDYSLAAKLANSGHELAIHTVTHRTPSTFWSEDRNNTEELTHEILDMRDILSRWAHVPKSNVVGYRTPFLASSENQLKILHENDFLYDCTMVTNEMYWPFTLDYKSPICSSPAVCPEESLPGLWVIPNINKVQNSSFSCSMIDSCAHPPKSTRDHWMHFFMHNFERHYNNSKAPFGLYAHASWFYYPDSAQRLQAFMDFLDYLGSLEDVYIVTMSQLIAWSRNPTPLDRLSTFEPWQCPNLSPTTCTHTDPNICKYSTDGEEFIIRLCKDDICPEKYPNITNPQGVNTTLSSTSVTLTSEIISTSITSTSHISSCNVMSLPAAGSEINSSSSTMITSVTASTTSVTAQTTSVTAQTTSVIAPRTFVTAQTTSVTAQTTSVMGQTSAATPQTILVTSPTTSVTATTTSVTAQTMNTAVTPETASVTAQTTAATPQTTSVTAQTTSVITPPTSVRAQSTIVTAQTTSVTAQTTSVTGQTPAMTPQTIPVTSSTTSVTTPITSFTAQSSSVIAPTTSVTAQTTAVAPQTTSVTAPTSSVTAPTTSVTTSTSSVTTSTTSVTVPTTSVTTSTTSVTAPTTSVTAPTTSMTTSTTSVTTSTTSVTVPTTSVTTSTTSVTAPTTSVTTSTTSVTVPTTSVTVMSTFETTTPTIIMSATPTPVTTPLTSVALLYTSVTTPTASSSIVTTTQSLTLSTSIQMSHVLISSTDPQSTTTNAHTSEDTRQQTHSVDPGVVAGVTIAGVMAISVAVTGVVSQLSCVHVCVFVCVRVCT